MPAKAAPQNLIRTAILRLRHGSRTRALTELRAAAEALEAKNPKPARSLRRAAQAIEDGEGARIAPSTYDKLRQIQQYVRNRPTQR